MAVEPATFRAFYHYLHDEQLGQQAWRPLSIDFPSISTGIFGYPVGNAAGVALGAAVEALGAPGSLTLVRRVLSDEPSYEAFAQAAHTLGLTAACKE